MAEETINEVRGATGGLVPPMLLDVAYIEALPRDHLTKMEDNEVGKCKVDRNDFIGIFNRRKRRRRREGSLHPTQPNKASSQLKRALTLAGWTRRRR